MACSEKKKRKNILKEYPKRSGTSGIQGHLYETKLLSLIYFRAIHDERIKLFHLATNVDKLGSFDDICFRAEVRRMSKPLTVFIQAKHREKNSVLKFNSKSDLVTYFKSYMEIRSKFKPNNKDVLFDGTFSETECLFVIYTTAKCDRPARKYEDQSIFGNWRLKIDTFLNELIGTEVLGSGLQPFDDTNIAELHQILLEEEMTTLAQLMAKCIHGEFNDIQMLMQEELVLKYHVILTQQVFNVSKDQSEGCRYARFKNDFFNIDEDLVQLFKDELCTEILKKGRSNCDLVDDEYDWDLPDTEYEYQQIGHLITYENRKFEFLLKIGSERYRPYLDKINESQETIQRTLEIAVKQCLPSLKFRVPASFGNTDLTIRGGDERKERKLIDLTSKIVGLIEKTKPGNIVMIDEESVRESLGEGFLQLSGGIASAVGNLLVLDDVSKLLKFNDNYESLGKLAKKLFDQLNCKIKNLCEYKFYVRAKIFPKVSFAADKYTRNIYGDFFKKLVFYTSQAKEAKVEKILITEIDKKLCCDDVYTRNIKSNIIFLKYHDDIQKWWMNKVGEYLTEEGGIYKNAERHHCQSLISFINMMHRINNKNYTFTEDAVNSIKLDNQPSGTVILTKNIALTVAKLINYVIKKDCIVLDIQYILNLSISDNEILKTELIDLNKEITLILVCDKAIFSRRFETIATFIESLRDRTKIIILNDQDSVIHAKTYLTIKENVLKDERNNLLDMSEESQKSVLENINVIFQGTEVSSDQILDNESLGLVGELVLYNLMQGDKNVIGKPVSHLNYKGKIYIERCVKCLKVVTQTRDVNDRKIEEGEIKSITTLYDLEEDVVLIIGDPGIGKSTLLTQLSLNTNQLDPTVWILRINLLEYSKQFFEWQTNKTVIDTLKSLKFLCRVALSEQSMKKNDVQITLKELNGAVSLKDCTDDEWYVFELKLFLYYYNTKQLIILFDGFDEICPTYTDEVLNLIRAVMNMRQKHKIWITSRSYDKIITELQLQILYKMEPLKNDEQDLYLSTFWDEKILLTSSPRVENNLYDFFTFISKNVDSHIFQKTSHLKEESLNEKPMLAVYLSLCKYLKQRNVRNFKDYEEFTSKFSKLVATPLHLNMLAEHLYNLIQAKDSDDHHIPGASEKWDLDVNIFQFYDHFLEKKLKIRFQEKNQTDMYRPDIIAQFMREYADTKDKLKKLAAYVVYDKSLLDKYELKHCEELIEKLKEGDEKTDIICNVVNDIPIFVHSTFAEYFAVEYICDLLKSQTDLNTQKIKMLYAFILNEMFFKLNKNVLVILDAKIKIDKQFTTLIEKNKEIIFTLLLEQGYITKNKHGCMKSSLCEAIRLGLRNLAFLLLSTTEDYLNDSNLMEFIEIVKDTNMFMMAVKMEFDELIMTIINQVRMICESKLSALFENIEIFYKNEDLARESTSDLVQKLHANVWTRMNIDPDWENLAGLSGEIYFI